MREALTLFDVLGVLLWIVSVAGEAAADRQLARFRADPSNRRKTCREGPLALLAASQLLLPVAFLVGFRVACRRRTALVADADQPDAHSVFYLEGDRHSTDRGTGVGQSRRRLPRVSAYNQRLRALVSQEIEPMTSARLLRLAIKWMEQGRVPDTIIRWGIRRLNAARLRKERQRTCASAKDAQQALIQRMREGPIAHVPEKANEQHYEVPARFFELVLGEHLKYSGCLWTTGTDSLDRAEAEMLSLTCARAELADGQRILELGCGWGSLSLWMAEHYPHARIVAVSNSAGQRRFIEARAAERGLDQPHGRHLRHERVWNVGTL